MRTFSPLLFVFSLVLLCCFSTTGICHRPSASYALGSYTRGCIQNAQKLNPEGAGYQTVRFSRQRLFGHPSLLQFIEKLATAAQDIWKEHSGKDQAQPLALGIGDLSGQVGGPALDRHKSHQNGLEADILYLPIPLDLGRLEREQLPWPSLVNLSTKEVNERFTQEQALLLFQAAQFPEVDRIFINPIILKYLCNLSWFEEKALRKMRPWFGHDDHFHVRLACPKDSKSFCRPQAPLPDSEDLCGATLQSWLFPKEPDSPKPKMKLPAKPYEPDPQCKEILAAVSLPTSSPVAKNQVRSSKKHPRTLLAQENTRGKKKGKRTSS